MGKDWQAVSDAIDRRLADLEMTQGELAQNAGVALMTVRELHRNLRSRKRSPRTLAALSEALGWPQDYLSTLAAGRTPSPHPREVNDPVLRALDEIQAELRNIQDRLAELEKRVADGDAGP